MTNTFSVQKATVFVGGEPLLGVTDLDVGVDPAGDRQAFAIKSGTYNVTFDPIRRPNTKLTRTRRRSRNFAAIWFRDLDRQVARWQDVGPARDPEWRRGNSQETNDRFAWDAKKARWRHLLTKRVLTQSERAELDGRYAGLAALYFTPRAEYAEELSRLQRGPV